MLQKSLRGLTPTIFWLTPEALTATLLLKMNRGVLDVAHMFLQLPWHTAICWWDSNGKWHKTAQNILPPNRQCKRLPVEFTTTGGLGVATLVASKFRSPSVVHPYTTWNLHMHLSTAQRCNAAMGSEMFWSCLMTSYVQDPSTSFFYIFLYFCFTYSKSFAQRWFQISSWNQAFRMGGVGTCCWRTPVEVAVDVDVTIDIDLTSIWQVYEINWNYILLEIGRAQPRLQSHGRSRACTNNLTQWNVVQTVWPAAAPLWAGEGFVGRYQPHPA